MLAAGMEGFKGEGHPSRSHPGREACRGKRVEVIGPDDPARHICADVFESGGDVTMVQLKTGMAGLPTPVYGLAVTHHAG